MSQTLLPLKTGRRSQHEATPKDLPSPRKDGKPPPSYLNAWQSFAVSLCKFAVLTGDPYHFARILKQDACRRITAPADQSLALSDGFGFDAICVLPWVCVPKA